jgi:ligand-binding SRPBCC domain-containing protein
MPTIRISIDINAPIQTCFDLARDAAFHVETAKETNERIVSGKNEGLFELGDEVTFEGRHLGIKQQLGAKITEFDSTNYFVDEMTKGAFQSLKHIHQFEALDNGQTRMTDIVAWTSPLGILGIIADKIAVERHMPRFLQQRSQRIKERAES